MAGPAGFAGLRAVMTDAQHPSRKRTDRDPCNDHCERDHPDATGPFHFWDSRAQDRAAEPETFEISTGDGQRAAHLLAVVTGPVP
jgi:hypothetical protein